MEYKNLNGLIYVSNLDAHDLSCLLKTRTEFTIIFDNLQHPENKKSYAVSFIKDNHNATQLTLIDDNGKAENKSPEEVVSMIKENIEYNGYHMTIMFPKSLFYQALPLIDNYASMSSEFVAGLIYMEYHDGLYHFVLKRKGGSNLPNELFYWQKTRDIFAFDENGPQLLYATEVHSLKQLFG